MKAAPVVCDTGPVLHLHEAGALELLPLIGSVYAPSEVQRELCQLLADWPAHRPAWLSSMELEQRLSQQATQWANAGLVHKAEADALALALQLKARWYLTDDTAARILAESLRVEAHGSLGVVLWAAAHGHLDRQESSARLEALFSSSLWVSAAVQAEARHALNRIYGIS